MQSSNSKRFGALSPLLAAQKIGKKINKLGLSWAKLSLAGVRISLVFIGLSYGEKNILVSRLRLTHNLLWGLLT